MKIIVFSAKPYEQRLFDELSTTHQLTYQPASLTMENITDAAGMDGICCFVTDRVDQNIINRLVEMNIKLIVLRSAGFDHIDVRYAVSQGMTICRVPKYSPEAIAEFAVALILLLNRKLIAAYRQGLAYNFSLDHLLGFNLKDKTVGIIGTGKIGTAFAKIMLGFGCNVMAYDICHNDTCEALGVRYAPLEDVLSQSHIMSLHCALNDKTHHLLNAHTMSQIKKGAMVINTGRGGLIHTAALIDALQSGQIGAAGLDVYEHEAQLFFKDHHGVPPKDEQFLALQRLPNVIITPHQAFFTEEAILNIMKTTLANISAYECGQPVNTVLLS